MYAQWNVAFFNYSTKISLCKFQSTRRKKTESILKWNGYEKNANRNWTLFLLVSNHSLVSLTTFSTWSWLLAYPCGFFHCPSPFCFIFFIISMHFPHFFPLQNALNRTKQTTKKGFVFCLFDSYAITGWW